MNMEMIIAVLGLFLTVLINIATCAYFAGVLKSNQENQKEILYLIKQDFERRFEENQEKTSEHFEQLEKKQDKHNSMIERQFKTESNVKELYEKIRVANHRIEDLENTH